MNNRPSSPSVRVEAILLAIDASRWAMSVSYGGGLGPWGGLSAVLFAQVVVFLQ